MEISSKKHDCVVFMTAYKINENKRKILNFGKSNLKNNILKQFHIESIATENNIITQKGALRYKRKFDTYKQVTTFDFDVKQKDKTLDDYKDEIDNVAWIFNLSHSMKLVIDSYLFTIPFYITMEKFLVIVDKRLLQVDPIAFFVNDLLFINYELIDYKTGIPLKKDEIFGRGNNYNILLTEKIRYFDENEFEDRTDKVSDIIFANITRCLEQIRKNKFIVDSFSFIHNIFVTTKKIDNIEKYFLNVLGVNDLDIDLKNINNNYAYKYYSQEYLGIVTEIDNDCQQQALFDGLLLEVMKMYFMLKQIINFDITNNLETTIDRQFELERIMYLSKVPIITLNAIENMKRTHSFKMYDEAIKFKLSYLKLYQEKKKNKNALLLNILLYTLAFMSGVGSIPVIQSAFNIPVKPCFIVLSVIFVIFGIVWVKSEIKK